MKKLSLYIFLIVWCCNFVNNANALPKKFAGTGELQLSEKIIDGYFDYVTQPSNKLPLVFFITKDKKDFYSVIINNDNEGYAGSETIRKKKIKCESKLKKKCDLFSNTRVIVWDNGINPVDPKVSKIASKISKEDFILKLTKLGFIINEEQQAIKKQKIIKQKVAKQKVAKQKIAKQKVAKKKVVKKKATKEKEDKKLLLIPTETDLEEAQNFLKNVQNFIKLYPDEFDIIKVSEFFILTKPIKDGDLNYKSKKDLEQFKEFTNSSGRFVEYSDDIKKNIKDNKLNKINDAVSSLEKNIENIKKFIVADPDSIYLEEWVINIKTAEKVLDKLISYDQLLITNENLVKLINSNDKIEATIIELNNNIEELKEILKQNLTTDLAPLIVEQSKMLEVAIKKQILKDMKLANQKFEEFISKKIKEPKLKAAKEEKIAKDKKLAKEKKEKDKNLAKEKKEKDKNLAKEKMSKELKKWWSGF